MRPAIKLRVRAPGAIALPVMVPGRMRAAIATLLAMALLAAGCQPGAESDRATSEQPPPPTASATPQVLGNDADTAVASLPTEPPIPITGPVQRHPTARSLNQAPEGPDDSAADPRPGPTGVGPARAGPPALPGAPAKPPAGNQIAGATEYTWQDGEQTQRVYLASDLIVLDDGEASADGSEIVARGGGRSIVRQPGGTPTQPAGQPVFRSAGGELMTLPGGVIVVFDPAWTRSQIDRFFNDHDVAAGRVQTRDYLPNAFLIATKPGFPSLELANQLAAADGVLISVPNWQTETTTR